MQKPALTLLCICGLIVTGCSAPDGTSAPYSPATQHITVEMPVNAPAIGQQFRVVPDTADRGGLGGDHLGLDVLSPRDAPVLAAADGVVVASFYEPAYGNRVEIAHGPDDEGRIVTTRSVHLNTRLVTMGEHVLRGQKIGTVGSTGALAGTLNHLHFETRLNGTGVVDPHLLWADGVGKVTCFDLDRPLPESPVRLTYPVQCR
ncbi:Murein hydrolase activator NlpD precursor [Thalassovita gelatinovora]|uniref:Murein hydrolase activator NlpD n=1 Tax=Thalassovita gelatinovora TaxID=53501 RepID=A0A0P1FEI8_THAGE|nr:M23 family metallopeptidase [Thalassovita gelatinovora]QIZ79645.1 M23 family metallopeptidase [Thalassovita gelatinovora]CUH66601.1 Murein hydrolase activator NlpD precursor [Thalassovita gelatinovora]SEQ38753.1 Peptidase family M23 [Thalassovita gelatinovora]